MGVGKTATCQSLKKLLPNAVFLDGDWCWDADPFQVTGETKHMVLDNICHLLNNFLHCSAYENVIFGWVLHQQEILDFLKAHLNTESCRVVEISLICSEKALSERLQKDIDNGLRTPDILERSLPRLPLYAKLSTVKIDVSDISASAAAEKIEKL